MQSLKLGLFLTVFMPFLGTVLYAEGLRDIAERFLFKPRPSAETRAFLESKGLAFLLDQSTLGRKVRVLTDDKVVIVLRGELHGKVSAKKERREALQALGFSPRNLVFEESVVYGSREEVRRNSVKGNEKRFQIKGLEGFEAILLAFTHRARGLFKPIIDAVESKVEKLGKVSRTVELKLFLYEIDPPEMRQAYLRAMTWFREGIGILIANPEQQEEYSQSMTSPRRPLLGRLGDFLKGMEDDYQSGKISLTELLNLNILSKEFDRICLVSFRALKEMDSLLRDLQEQLLLKAPIRYRSAINEMMDDPGTAGYEPLVEWRNDIWVDNVRAEVEKDDYSVLFMQVGKLHVDDFAEKLFKRIPKLRRIL